MTLPVHQGVRPSRYQLPSGPWSTVLDALCARFSAIDRRTWQSRFARGRVLDSHGMALTEDAPYRVGADIYYYREIAVEPRIDVQETILHVDEHLIVVDKPHFLPTTPGGAYAAESLLARLIRRFGDIGIAPLHRLDRLTAGLVLFSPNPATRSQYQAMFRAHTIKKRYEALAPPMPHTVFPLERHTRLVEGQPFFRMQEIAGEPNALTFIDVIERNADTWRYTLSPVSGQKHQLRVHMAALGAPIQNDPLYPQLVEQAVDDANRPLKLLAQSVMFADPLDSRQRCFESRLAI